MKLREKLFLAVAFFLGTWGAVYNVLFVVCMITMLIINVWGRTADFWKDLKEARFYIGLPVILIIYQLLHTIVYPLFVTNLSGPAYGSFEILTFFFILPALYVLSLKHFMTVKLLMYALFAFCLGTFSFNFISMIWLTDGMIFTHPVDAVTSLYNSRFGGNKAGIFGGNLNLEPQALYICIATLLSYFLIYVGRGYVFRSINLVLFFFSLFFLSLTITKGSIIAFVFAFILLNISIFKKRLLTNRLVLSSVILAICLVGCLFLSDAYSARIEEAKKEVEGIISGDGHGGSLTPRFYLWKTSVEHIDEYAVWGLGVYTRFTAMQWYNETDCGIDGMTNSHNSFLQYWIIGGIVGLCFVFGLLLMPIWRQYKNKRYSFLILAIILSVFIANNVCVLLIYSDSASFIAFFLAMCYFYGDDFYMMETECSVIKRT